MPRQHTVDLHPYSTRIEHMEDNPSMNSVHVEEDMHWLLVAAAAAVVVVVKCAIDHRRKSRRASVLALFLGN